MIVADHKIGINILVRNLPSLRTGIVNGLDRPPQLVVMVGIEPIVTGLLDSQNKTHRIGYGILHRARFGGGFHIVKISKTPVDIIHLMILRKCTVIIRRPDHRGRTSPLVIKSVGEIYVVLRGIAAGSGTQITGHENISGSRSNRLRRRIVLRNPHLPTPNHLILGIESCDQCVSFDKLWRRSKP